MACIIVMGASGFIGQEAVRAALTTADPCYRGGHKVVAIDSGPLDLSTRDCSSTTPTTTLTNTPTFDSFERTSSTPRRRPLLSTRPGPGAVRYRALPTWPGWSNMGVPTKIFILPMSERSFIWLGSVQPGAMVSFTSREPRCTAITCGARFEKRIGIDPSSRTGAPRSRPNRPFSARSNSEDWQPSFSGPRRLSGPTYSCLT